MIHLRISPAVVSVIVALVALPAPAQDDAWRDALERFEQRIDEMLGELTDVDSIEPLVTGIRVPPGPTPRDAKALAQDWPPLRPPAPRRAVLLVHGLDEPGDIWMDLAPELVARGYDVVRFEYPNDQRIHDSGAMLLDELRQAREGGLTEVFIVGHSMGGLVSFDALTRADGYAGRAQDHDHLPRVTRVITLGTPWAGSPLAGAGLQPISEIREQVTRAFQEGDPRPLLHYRRDGSGQADDDLRPDSPVLAEFAQRPWPEGLPYSRIVGRIASPSPNLDAIARAGFLADLIDPHDLDQLVGRIDKLTNTVGDGVVPLDSAQARDADEAYVFEVNHRSLIRRSVVDFLTGSGDPQEPGGPPVPPAIPVVLETLERDWGAPETHHD